MRRKLIKGTAISSGIVLGQIRLILAGEIDIAELSIPASRVYAEVELLDKAVEETIIELREFRESAGKKMGGPIAKIFDAQLMIASDYEFLKSVKKDIAILRRNAGFIYNKHIKKTITPLKQSSEPYMQRMAIDIEAVAKRVLSSLSGYNHKGDKFQPNTILVGKMFTPGEIISFRQRKAIGFVVSEGSSNSHMALITRGLMLPAVVIEDIHSEVKDNSPIIIDGVNGDIIVNPTDEDLSNYQKLKKKHGPAKITRIKRLSEIPPKTSDGKIVNVGVNLALPGPVDDILTQYNFPVGLYRTEFLYLSHYEFPDEEMQFNFYSSIAQKYKHTSVILRTYDLGYDKISPNSTWAVETNPALGWRGIRAMLDMSHIFKTQIRAILRASTLNNLKIMLPMISDLTELEKAKKYIQQVKFQLQRENIAFDKNIQLGIMVEVPSAALTADVFARKVDFISIGTNDLTQYTLAADRLNQKIASLYSAFHPSVLNLIQLTVRACKKNNIPVSICGEIAGDLLALPLFIGMDIDSLSMNPSRIFDLCRLVKNIDSRMVKHLAESVLSSETQKEVLTKLVNYKNELEKKKPLSKRKI